MADELMSFPRTEEVMRQLAEEFRQEYIKNLVRDGRFTYFGTERLVDTITAKVTVDDKSFTASLNMNAYWESLEYGTGPERGRAQYWPPTQAIARWVQVKPAIPRPGDNGRIPTPKQLTYFIKKKIHDEGTKGTHDFEKTQNEVLPRYYERIGTALSEDIGDYIRAVFVW